LFFKLVEVLVPVATVIESLLRSPMRISAPGNCNNAFRQLSGALAADMEPHDLGPNKISR
jgi:hypothetical protein